MADDPKPDSPTDGKSPDPGPHWNEPPPPFEPDLDLIGHMERAQKGAPNR